MARGLLFDACLRVVELLAGLKPGAYIQGSPRMLRGEPVTCITEPICWAYLLGR